MLHKKLMRQLKETLSQKMGKIVITLSGGMDSAVLLYKAAEEYKNVHTVTFDYGQRHSRELCCAEKQLINAKHDFPNVMFTNTILDAKFIKNIAPCLEFGLVGKTMHKIDESVSVSDLKKLTKIYKNILVSYFK